MLPKLCGEYRFKLAVWFYFEYYFALLMCLFCGHLTHVTTALPAFFRGPSSPDHKFKCLLTQITKTTLAVICKKHSY